MARSSRERLVAWTDFEGSGSAFLLKRLLLVCEQQTMDGAENAFLQKSVGPALTQAMTAMIVDQPPDAVEVTYTNSRCASSPHTPTHTATLARRKATRARARAPTRTNTIHMLARVHTRTYTRTRTGTHSHTTTTKTTTTRAHAHAHTHTRARTHPTSTVHWELSVGLRRARRGESRQG